MIIIFGSHQEQHHALVFEELKARNIPAAFFDPGRYPYDIQLSMPAGDPASGSLKLLYNQVQIPLKNITAIYSRYFAELYPACLIREQDPFLKDRIKDEITSGLGSFCRNLDCVWVDHIESYEMHLYKGYQYTLLAQAGIRIPDTLISNDPEAIRDFYERHGGQVVYKPCWFGAFTTMMTEADFTPERLQTLSQAPVCFQEYIPGTDVLAFCIGQRTLLATDAVTDKLDYRTSPTWTCTPIELPAQVAQDCVTLAELFNLNFTLIDMRRTPDGEYVFFEGNPSPIFRHIEAASGLPVTEKLVDFLVSTLG